MTVRVSDMVAMDFRGLTSEAARRRLAEIGPNELPEAKPDRLPVIFLRQFQSPLIYVLLAAAVAVYWLGETVDALVIMAVLVFNAIVGTIQEGRAQQTLHALKTFVETNATVVRDGSEVIIPDREVVPGDVLIVQEGDKVAADAEIISAHNLKLDEAAFTGESEAVFKSKGLIFKGTHVVAGNSTALVTATGDRTEVGKIAAKVATIDTEIPLKANIRALSRLIIIAVATICALIFTLGLALGNSAREMFATVVSLAVSIIPEGLPIVMTLVLATGVWRMSKRNALVKRLQAVEALGQARVIAVDKTGTLTKNEMTVQRVYADGRIFDITGSGYDPAGGALLMNQPIDPPNHPELLHLGKIAALCASARVSFDAAQGRHRVSGDPTEAALLVFGEKMGFKKTELEREDPLLAEIPFDSKLQYHATLHADEDKKLLTVVGAPEVVLNLSNRVKHGGKRLPLTSDEKNGLEAEFQALSRAGLRVLGAATSRVAPEPFAPAGIHELTFVGFFAMKDALRPEAREAVTRARSAGIRVVMITGDYPATARAIAEEAGIYQPDSKVLTGAEIDSLSDAELARRLEQVTVFARVKPNHKLRIINAFKSRGEVVAMTGDGVNDAPSLVAADLGVAMGRIGTEVAKEAADIVLLDDNFGSIVSAVEEGRSIYKTIKKVILYLFSTSFGEVFTIAGALLIGLPLPILPAQIIWLNFVTDGFLDVALAMEPKEKGLLSGTFERPKKYLVDKLMAQRMALMAAAMVAGTLFLFARYQDDPIKAWTVSLTTLAVFQWFNAWNSRSEGRSIFQMNPLANRFLVGATGIVIILQILAVYNPMLQRVLRTTPLELGDWLVIVPVAASIIVVEEVRKLFFRAASMRRT